jgi:hypothetical protein
MVMGLVHAIHSGLGPYATVAPQIGIQLAPVMCFAHLRPHALGMGYVTAVVSVPATVVSRAIIAAAVQQTIILQASATFSVKRQLPVQETAGVMTRVTVFVMQVGNPILMVSLDLSSGCLPLRS